ncbi:MAG: hypothetical protein ACRELB_24690 [Polyangiaceae bacterium]
MAIVGHHPESGVRIDIERERAGEPPWRYEGEVVTPSERFRVAAVLGVDGGVAVELQVGAPPSLAEKTRLLVRAVWRHSHEADAPPPRHIVRWRADR